MDARNPSSQQQQQQQQQQQLAQPQSLSVTGQIVRESKDSPIRKVTTGLLRTYKLINERYYVTKRELKASQERREVDYQVTAGQLLGNYRVIESMGKGSFGQVVSAEDMRDPGSGRKVAVKVIKNREAFRRQAKTEIKLLDMLNKKDEDDQWCIGACPFVLRLIRSLQCVFYSISFK
jgi:serine/threonine protein kinase